MCIRDSDVSACHGKLEETMEDRPVVASAQGRSGDGVEVELDVDRANIAAVLADLRGEAVESGLQVTEVTAGRLLGLLQVLIAFDDVADRKAFEFAVILGPGVHGLAESADRSGALEGVDERLDRHGEGNAEGFDQLEAGAVGGDVLLAEGDGEDITLGETLGDAGGLLNGLGLDGEVAEDPFAGGRMVSRPGIEPGSAV